MILAGGKYQVLDKEAVVGKGNNNKEMKHIKTHFL